MIQIRIENTYADGHEEITEGSLPEPRPGDGLDDWWEEEVWPLTGTGHSGDACYTATIVGASERTELIGQSREWV